jgi:hypothetical protein
MRRGWNGGKLTTLQIGKKYRWTLIGINAALDFSRFKVRVNFLRDFN